MISTSVGTGMLGLILFASVSLAMDGRQPVAARYLTIGAAESGTPSASAVTVWLLDSEEIQGRTWQRWRLTIELADGAELGVEALSERAPMTSPDGCGAFASYVFRQRDGQTMRYRTPTGQALLPKYAFRESMLPTPSWQSPYVDGFAAAGNFLGHMAQLDRVRGVNPVAPWDEPSVITLDPDLLIGTSRAFKDDGRKPPTVEDNYWFVNYDKQDYDDMLRVGINYVGVRQEQREWVENRDFFFRIAPVFPDDLYRGNYRGMSMFTDEPMVRMGWQGVTPEQLYHPHQVTSMLMTRVGELYRELNHPHRLEQAIRAAGHDLGLMRVVQRDVPTWETVYESAFYELAGGAPGIVHEGRYIDDGYGWHPPLTFGSMENDELLPMTSREMLSNYYAYLRGAARAFDASWGTAIYGQSDPKYRLPAMTLAYDMGARYIWFWTSDHEHHVPWTEQLSLTESFMRHVHDNPRHDPTDLRAAAELAIVYPVGYSASWGHIWGERAFGHDNINSAGTLYRDVVGAAMWEGVLAAKRGESFDFTVDHPNLEQLGYKRMIRVHENGDVTVEPRSISPRRPRVSLALALEAAVPIELPRPATTSYWATPLHGRHMTIDGELGEWSDADWFSLPTPKVAGETWSGTQDLSGRLAFGYDGERLYIAADINDDHFHQPYEGWPLWNGDSLQIGLDPLLTRNEMTYTENQHEIGLAVVRNERAIVWRFEGRKGQPLDEITGAEIRIRRNDRQGKTLIEAAVPLSELAPLSPIIRPMSGISMVLNDNDGEGRKNFLETTPGALTTGKHPAMFETLRFMPPQPEHKAAPGGPRAWATLLWNAHVAPSGGYVSLTLAHRAWEETPATITARLEALPPLQVEPAETTLPLSIATVSQEQTLRVNLDAGPGRYQLRVKVRDEGGRTLVDERQTVYVF